MPWMLARTPVEPLLVIELLAMCTVPNEPLVVLERSTPLNAAGAPVTVRSGA